MKICFLGLDNLPVLAPEFGAHGIGGEQVQQSLLAKVFASQHHEVSMVVYDYGQADLATWHGITTYKAYRQDAGFPVIRFVYPRWTSLWKTLRKINADIYYMSCAGMHLGMLAMFCKRHGGKLVFRVAHDFDCDPKNLLIQYWRDKKLYEYGLRHADGILVQSEQQRRAMFENYGLNSVVAEMLVDTPTKSVSRDVDVLWVNNLRQFKRPDLFLALAKRLPQLKFHMIGGPQPGFSELFESIRCEALQIPNLTFHGGVPYQKMDEKYSGARVFVNTSDSEGFPNSYLQAWIRGTPVVAFFDPDAVIEREGLGRAVSNLDEMARSVSELVEDQQCWSEASRRCKAYMAVAHAESRIVRPYLDMFEKLN
jgi:glycosyltransferase involved in cell wall biosynthesis